MIGQNLLKKIIYYLFLTVEQLYSKRQLQVIRIIKEFYYLDVISSQICYQKVARMFVLESFTIQQ